ncbi:74c60d2a-5953-40eb-8f19-ae6c13e4201a [Sclerotinia trifoliorum]|uniref:74c60d2a-5953-40eb-8f19-ae6c13e4201a n=1 Tax=Sclerotinia trifoliorum TaxID=28548 RepID=A0A8H2W425_9HELO|nr:74c60d2a-5953-40eb-8f19-ae6c13e4201a [Sclerotinia trifoliorum]
MFNSFRADYHGWLEFKENALPSNIFGYLLVQYFLRYFKCEPFDTVCYDDPKEIAKCGTLGQRSFLKEPLQMRDGPRPEMAKWVVPHRQVDKFGGRDMHKLIDQTVIELARRYPNHITLTTSALEKHGDAILIADRVPTPHLPAKKTKREIAHVHTEGKNVDYSMHAVLSPRDCKEVIEKGWGEKMTLAGTLKMPAEYLMIYTPRSESELRAVRDILEAAIGFMTGATRPVEE